MTSSAWSQLTCFRSRSTSDVSCLADKKRRRAAAEIDEAKRPPPHHRLLADQLDLVLQRLAIRLDLLGVLVRIDAEIAELAPLAAERNVQIQAQRHVAAAADASAASISGKLLRPHCENGG